MGVSSRMISTGGFGDSTIIPLGAGARVGASLGAKAANLARARAAGLPVVDGFVLPPRIAAEVASARRDSPVDSAPVAALRVAWSRLSHFGNEAVVVRSSSVAEDTAASSQAGVFESVVDVRGWDPVRDAVTTVVGSASRAAGTDAPAPIAVLVQQHIDPAWAGVMFGVDPVSGRSDRLVVAAVPGGPQQLVGGVEAGTRIVLDRRGHVVEGSRRSQPLSWRTRRGLARLAASVEALFGGPQDIEWAVTEDGRLLLLQSRPVTAVGAVGIGPVLGPGPVAETFPEPLRSLEQDLWLTPLQEALRVVLALTGRATRRALDRSPIALAVEGRPAVDLDLFEAGNERRRGLALLDPRPPLRRLRVAWRVGRLRASLPTLAAGLANDLDRELADVPPVDELTDLELLGSLDRVRAALRAAHGHELLAGTLDQEEGASGAELGLVALAAGRREGWTDEEIVAADPIVLALTVPAIAAHRALPVDPPAGSYRQRARALAPLGPREALRVRIRWLHELTSLLAWELGVRLAEQGQLADEAQIADLRLATIERAVRTGAPVAPGPPVLTTPPLPARFRLAEDGTAVAEPVAHEGGTATGAGGGRGVGRVDQSREPMEGAVLVVPVLDPRLAPLLPGLGGLVAETGSPLSHLAILAREHRVPTVVGVPDATKRFLPGTEVLVDGTSGEVRVISESETEEVTVR